MEYGFDRFLRYDELVEWLHGVAADHPDLVALETYGTSHEGRDLWIVTVTDASTGAHDTKPAHWVDASIHAVELTATVAACHLIHRLATGAADPLIAEALRTRTFYIVPRVNPDGAEWALADRPKYRRSSTRPWPWRDGHRWPGLEREDVDGDGRILQMRIADEHGAWMPHPGDERLLVPVPPIGVAPGAPRYRVLSEGTIRDYDGFTIDTPRPVEGLDLNRNYPAGWGTDVPGAGDHPLSEPEIDALVRAIVARPNVCGFNAFHTFGGVLLRPSSTRSDSALAPMDVWVWKELAARGTELTGYPGHSVFDDFTWDKSETMSGASDDWAYEHLGIYSWTTEFWDPVHAATGERMSTTTWTTGPTDDQQLAVLRWCDEHNPGGYVDWYAFDHPQLGAIELGGWNEIASWTNPPLDRLRDEVAPHSDFAVHQAMCSPQLEIVHTAVRRIADDTWMVEAGVANVGWLPTDVSALARKSKLAQPLTVEMVADDGTPIEILDGPARRRFGQLEGRVELRFRGGNDGTPDRILATWTVRAPAGSACRIVAAHERCGRVEATCTLE